MVDHGRVVGNAPRAVIISNRRITGLTAGVIAELVGESGRVALALDAAFVAVERGVTGDPDGVDVHGLADAVGVVGFDVNAVGCVAVLSARGR